MIHIKRCFMFLHLKSELNNLEKVIFKTDQNITSALNLVSPPEEIKYFVNQWEKASLSFQLTLIQCLAFICGKFISENFKEIGIL